MVEGGVAKVETERAQGGRVGLAGFSQICKRSNATAVSNWLQIVLSPNRFAFCTPLILIHSVI